MSFSNYLENKLLDHVFGSVDYTPPTTIYAALYTSDPTDDGSGTEVSGNDYERVAITNNTTNFPSASGGAKTNGTKISFPTPSGSWGEVTHMGLLDASTNGNLLGHAELDASKSPGAGIDVFFDAGELDITLT